MDNARIRRKKRQQRVSMITNIVFCIITLAALTGCIILLLKNYTLKNQSEEVLAQLHAFEEQSENYIYTQSDLDAYLEEEKTIAKEEEREAILGELKSKMNGSSTATSMLRDFFPEDVVVYADGGYHFFPIDETLKKHDYVYDNFKQLENGQVEYVDDTDEILSKKGIDVSKYQGDIDWKKVSADGVEYVFIRAGVRGSTEGKIMEDEKFADNIEGALDNDIEVGVYFFTQAVTQEEAIEEAEFVLKMIKDYDVTYPIVLDVEEVTSTNARTAELTKEDYTRNCIAFCETIRDAGYTPMIYGNLKTFMMMLDMTQLEDYQKWFAYYSTPVYFPYEFDIWQYSSKGTVNGIKGDVDLNICMKDFSGQN
ncbi:MAG: glycoside hydrolase family 25 protein [Suilimivivens sp.]